MCFSGFVFACFVFVGVFISDEGEPGRVCQAPVRMEAIISSSFDVYVCVHGECVSIVVLKQRASTQLHVRCSYCRSTVCTQYLAYVPGVNMTPRLMAAAQYTG